MLKRYMQLRMVVIIVPVVLLNLIDEAHAAYCWTDFPLRMGFITAPSDGAYVVAGGTLDWGVTALDLDTKCEIQCEGCEEGCELPQTAEDTFNWSRGITWTSSPENNGSFSNPSFEPPENYSGTWTAPTDYAGSVTLTVTLNDKAEIPDGDLGDRDDQNLIDSVTVNVVEVEIFDNDGKWTTPLEDAERIFTDKDIDAVYIQVKNAAANQNPAVAETFNVKVTSESDPNDGVTITLKETGNDTGVFQNRAIDGEMLYLSSTGSSEGAKDYIHVANEEKIKVAFEPPNSAIFKEVIVDKAEVGIGWFQDYGDDPNNGYGNDDCIMYDLVRTKENAEYVYDTLKGNNEAWEGKFNKGNTACLESGYDSAGDSGADGADTVDLVVWAGHGPNDQDYSYLWNGTPKEVPAGTFTWASVALHYYTDSHNDNPARADNHDIYRSEVAWGDDDLDWICLFTCSFLEPPQNEAKALGSGVRLICGFSDVMTMHPKEKLAKYFLDKCLNQNKSIKQAWKEMGERADQPGHWVVVGNTNTENDHLPGHGSYAKGKTFTLDQYWYEQ